MKGVTRLSLRPYNGVAYFARTREAYERAHRALFREPDRLSCAQQGRFSAAAGPEGLWTYLVWAETHHTLAHELSHIALHVAERCGWDPREACGEPFCYLLSQLILDAAL